MAKIYRVKLEPSEREALEEIIKKDKCAAHKQRHARILLKADENRSGGAMSDQQIAEAVEAGIATVQRVRRVFVLHGLERALTRKDPDRVYQRKLDAKGEARLIAVTCEKPPDGRDKWTLKLLSEKLIELEVVDSIGIETVRTTLKKTTSNHGRKSSGV
jgi:transposase